MKRQLPLDGLNFFIADVKDGLGPFLAVYLLSSQHWNPGSIGVVMAIAGTATVLARTPMGGLVDWIVWKRGLIIVAALMAGIAGWAINPGAVLWLTALMAALSIGAVLSIDGKAIDHKMARGAAENQQSPPLNLFGLFACKPLLIFTIAITLFHFANAAMLPLLGQKLAQTHPDVASLVIASCIIAAQVVMVPMAILVGYKADTWGRKPIFLAAFAVLPLRGFLYTLSQDPYYLISIQILDGIGAGIFGALFYIVIADLTQGTGRYNLALGAASTCWGLGAALSHLTAGFIVDQAGYNAAFLCLSGIALTAFLLFWLAMSETGKMRTKDGEAFGNPADILQIKESKFG